MNRMEGMVKKIWNAMRQKKAGGWYNAHMAAASHAISQRIPLVDFVLEVRDARIPFSSQCHLFNNDNNNFPKSRRIIVLNKTDLSNSSLLKDWFNYFQQQNCIAFGVNSHNTSSVKQFLNFLQKKVRESEKTDESSCATTIMMVGIPNVGKSALANSLHQIGRTSAAEKGKLRRAIVSPYPGETKDISFFKIGSHPNIYILDTPGILPPKIIDMEIFSKLALTGAFKDCLIGEKELARYFLAILCLNDEYRKWTKTNASENVTSILDQKTTASSVSETDKQKKYFTDHTQDLVVHGIRQALALTISCFNGNLQTEKDLEKLIELQVRTLKQAFHVSVEPDNDSDTKVASKLLNLYRTGRLGHYTLETPD
ncbi:hypothetical protein K2173_005704 [Erythroxylum novogranatense]|uniref:G domain-containing protein n=1 Tax=Erythroxylum novogranatense TaxID=1862640 RepID=A0AAV8SQR2_9ROSI|nr:hypothetical protein K2173_005704 [Erythroxylum novogranatense]